MTDSVYWIWFQLLFGIGNRRSALLMDYFASPRELYDGIAANSRAVCMLEPTELSESPDAWQRAVEIQRITEKKGCHIVTPDHPSYPPQLAEVYGRPAALYVKGDLSCLENTLVIAMVGTRHRTEYGKQAAVFVADGLARQGVTVVSGLAPGIDADCHQAALAAGGPTVGVMGCGLDIDYPAGNRELKRAMSQNGAVISEYPMGTLPTRYNFPVRNRVISGMAHGVVVVEADLRSGSLITARCAREQGREIFAIPGSIFARGEQGTHKLIQQGARLVDKVEDVLERFPQYRQHMSRTRPSQRREPVQVVEKRPPLPDDHPDNLLSAPAPKVAAPKKLPIKQPQPQSLPDSATAIAAEVYQRFGSDTLTVDDVASATKLATGDILSALTELEIYGVVVSYPGRRFGLCLSDGIE